MSAIGNLGWVGLSAGKFLNICQFIQFFRYTAWSLAARRRRRKRELKKVECLSIFNFLDQNIFGPSLIRLEECHGQKGLRGIMLLYMMLPSALAEDSFRDLEAWLRELEDRLARSASLEESILEGEIEDCAKYVRFPIEQLPLLSCRGRCRCSLRRGSRRRA